MTKVPPVTVVAGAPAGLVVAGPLTVSALDSITARGAPPAPRAGRVVEALDRVSSFG